MTYHIEVTEAKGLVVFFDQLQLGAATTLRAYSPTTQESTRLYHSNDHMELSSFALPFIKGENVVLEFACMSIEDLENLEFSSTEIGVLHSLNGFGDAPDCYANVNCSEGDSYQDQKRSVVKYMTVSNGEIGLCSGVLMNNTNENCTNFFLSAQHCTIGSSEAELGQYVFYFNYESTDCTNPMSETGLDQQTVTGCTKLAESGGAIDFPPDRSDFALLLINPIPTA